MPHRRSTHPRSPHRFAPCLTFRVKSASPEHDRALRTAVTDLNAALGHRAFGLSPRGRNLVTFAPEAFDRDDPKTIGHVVDLPGDRWVVSIRPTLEGAALLATIMHELGHVLGLDHVKSARGHVMAIELQTRRKAPTRHARRRWAVQIAHEAAKMRARAQI